MGYRFDNLRLEKGMYNEAGRSFTQVLEREDPSEQYKGTALEGLDAYQRQLKRFDIKVKGAGSDAVEKFFATSQSAVLFPESGRNESAGHRRYTERAYVSSCPQSCQYSGSKGRSSGDNS